MKKRVTIVAVLLIAVFIAYSFAACMDSSEGGLNEIPENNIKYKSFSFGNVIDEGKQAVFFVFASDYTVTKMEATGSVLDKTGNTIDTFDTTLNFSTPSNNPEIYTRIDAELIKEVKSVSFTKIKAYTTEKIGSKSTPINPVTSIRFDCDTQAIEIGKTVTVVLSYQPTNSTESFTWESSDEDVIVVENGVITAKKIGNAVVTARAIMGKAYASLNIKVMPKYQASDLSVCKEKAAKAVLTIENRGYNDTPIFGITTSSNTVKSSGVIFKKIGNKYYFITAYSNLQRQQNYENHSLYATDYNGNSYRITVYKYENDKSLGNNYKLAIGYIEANNQLGVLNLEERDYFYKGERLFVKDGSQFYYTTALTSTTSSPIRINYSYKNAIIGSPIFDCEANFVGIGIRKSTSGNTLDFASSHFINKFIKQCGL